ncbi:hypothetical protein [Streptomyces sp. NPDC059378]|uniref:hypothetical protein n=1 Tax=Streptomyces sp. NPDC059378 TaxID=3346815 RepID=UPI0036B91099
MMELDVRPLGDLTEHVPPLLRRQLFYGEDDSDGLVDHGVRAHRFEKLRLLFLQLLHTFRFVALHLFRQQIVQLDPIHPRMVHRRASIRSQIGYRFCHFPARPPKASRTGPVRDPAVEGEPTWGRCY